MASHANRSRIPGMRDGGIGAHRRVRAALRRAGHRRVEPTVQRLRESRGLGSRRMSETLRFISAGAGTGKTYRLTQLLHDMLVDGRVRPSGILATTFTKKAAAELRQRVRSHLIKQGQYAHATAIGQARIGTVNSVCGNLLARFAFEAGMPMEQRVLDEPSATQ